MSTMLKKHEGLTVGEIWYNCYRRTERIEHIELNNQQKAILKQIQNTLPVEFDAINYREITATQGKTLAQTILCNEKFKRVWKTEYITCNTEDFDIPGGCLLYTSCCRPVDPVGERAGSGV